MQTVIEYPMRRRLLLYFTAVFCLSWCCWFNARLGNETAPVLDRYWFIAQLGVFAPSLVAAAMTMITKNAPRKNGSRILLSVFGLIIFTGYIISDYRVTDLDQMPAPLRVWVPVLGMGLLIMFMARKRTLYAVRTRGSSLGGSFRWLMLAWILYPALFIFLWLLTGTVVGGEQSLLRHTLTASWGAAAAVTIFFDFIFGGAVGEEIGWRGYALPLLLQRYRPLTASLLLGVVWSLWHLPIDMATGFGVQGTGGVVLRLLTVCPMSVIITWFYLRTGYSLAAALLLHSGINLIPAMGLHRYELTFGLLILVQLVAGIIIAVFDDGMKNDPAKTQNGSGCATQE